MKRYLSILAVLAIILGATTASAITVTPINPRPQPLGTSSEMPLQQMLNQIYGTGNINAAVDQQTAAVWELPGLTTGVTGPVLQFEAAGNAASNVFGIWSFDGTKLIEVPIFNGAAEGQKSAAQLGWAEGSPDTVIIHDTSVVPIAGAVNAGSFTGINRYFFGFYISGPGGTFYSADSLNPDNAAQMFAYLGPGGRWTFAFEDTLGGDGDHNDLVASVESIIPVPEPTSMLLLGTGLFGLAAFVRRRK